MVVPPAVTLYLGQNEAAGEHHVWGTAASQDKQLPLSRAPGRGKAAPPGTQTSKSAQQAPPPEDQLEGQGKSKFLTEQCWKAPGEVEGFIVYRTRGYPSLVFLFCFFLFVCFLCLILFYNGGS